MKEEQLEFSLSDKETLYKLEWSGTLGCEGYYMGDPNPMHYHPVCPICGGLKPNGGPGGNNHEGCFNEEARRDHKVNCSLKRLIEGVS